MNRQDLIERLAAALEEQRSASKTVSIYAGDFNQGTLANLTGEFDLGEIVDALLPEMHFAMNDEDADDGFISGRVGKVKFHASIVGSGPKCFVLADNTRVEIIPPNEGATA